MSRKLAASARPSRARDEWPPPPPLPPTPMPPAEEEEEEEEEEREEAQAAASAARAARSARESAAWEGPAPGAGEAEAASAPPPPPPLLPLPPDARARRPCPPSRASSLCRILSSSSLPSSCLAQKPKIETSSRLRTAGRGMVMSDASSSSEFFFEVERGMR